MSSCLPFTRRHFCTDVARGGLGGGSSPRMMGRNWFMPALANMGAAGWWGMRPIDGTRVCPRSTKKPVKARRSSAAFRLRASMAVEARLPSRGAAVQLDCLARGPRPHGSPQLGLTLPHGRPPLVEGGPDIGPYRPGPVAHVLAHPLRHEPVDRAAQGP